MFTKTYVYTHVNIKFSKCNKTTIKFATFYSEVKKHNLSLFIDQLNNLQPKNRRANPLHNIKSDKL